MNLFILDTDPVLSARYMCDKHIVKMITESAQVMSTAHRVLDGRLRDKTWIHPDPIKNERLYRVTHQHHPVTKWTMASDQNYKDHYTRWVAMHDEYNSRYGRDHLAFTKTHDLLRLPPANIVYARKTPYALAMPDQYKSDDPVQSYRAYYIGDKSSIAEWNHGDRPDWFQEQ